MASQILGDPGLVAAGALASTFCACAWVYVARRLLRRTLAPEHRAGGLALPLAFFAAAAYTAVNALVAAALLVGVELGDGMLAAAWAALALGLATSGGLVAYLAHLLTGSRRAAPLVAAAYALALGALVGVVVALEPRGALANGWGMRFDFAAAPDSANGLIATAVLAPAGVASLAYLALLPRTRDPTARWRIALVGGGMALWFAAAVGGRLAGGEAWQLAGARMAALVAAAAVFLAYSPPAWAARRGVRRLADEIPRAADDPHSHAAFAERVRDLV